jgi:hypothetical protein
MGASSAISPSTGYSPAYFVTSKNFILAIGDYTDRHNENPKPFMWTAYASDILGKVTRARRVLDKMSL